MNVDKLNPKPVVIIGQANSASLIHHALIHDSDYEVAGFAVEQEYMQGDRFEGLPVVAFEQLESRFPADDFQLINPVGYYQINSARRRLFEQAKVRGYGFASYISSRASVWADLEVGENVIIYEHAIIQAHARIGDNTIIRAGANISHHCEVGSHSFIANSVTLGGKVHIGEQAFLGLASVVIDQTNIAPRTFVGAGAVVTKPTQEWGVYVGSPARKLEKSAFDAV